MHSPQRDALETAERSVPVFAKIEKRVVAEQLRAPLTFVAGTTYKAFVLEASKQAESVAAAAPAAANASVDNTGAAAEAEAGQDRPSLPKPYVPDIDAAVVSAVLRSPGSVVSTGQVIGEVSNRPVIAIPGEVPLFRNLVVGTRGEDVAGLQRMLIGLGYYGVDDSGEMGSGTLNAMARLYQEQGYQLPFVGDGVRGVNWRELLRLPKPTMTVVSVAQVGEKLNGDTPFMAFEDKPAVLKTELTVPEAEALAPGVAVGVQIDSAQPLRAAVHSRGDAVTNKESGKVTREVVLPLPEGVTSDSLKGATALLVSLDTAAESLAVPLTALRQDRGKTYVLVPTSENKAASAEKADKRSAAGGSEQVTAESERGFLRISVTPTKQAAGWVSLKTDELEVGAEVLVSKLASQ
ncbi:hypothetical protein G7068_09485 [Leucobacter viscericola]|uniref:Peptidoglycan binding-like domain-containing protein n=1 Tax=Leucobacter viscericola TaxID=2714935 RepID=A0A6G7XFR8_9MICO|nr:hypothetical protein [Leucobacter viscericola]QIK63405.1 hypothetical protein G7068_09485 [Leucobacter viscericola]